MNSFHPAVRWAWWILVLPLALAAWAASRPVKSTRNVAYVGAAVLAVFWIGGIASAAGGSGKQVDSSKTDAAPEAVATTTTSPQQPRPSAPAAAKKTTSAPTQDPSARAEKAVAAAKPGTALAAVGTLSVKGRAPMTGYSREQFGQAWHDYDHNGCDTRNDILRRDLKSAQIKAGSHGCKVLSGDSAPDPYAGTSIHFVYGGASEIDIDHVVALGDAWQKGAQQWSADKRLRLANDPLNLLAVSASANRQKGDADAATWLPANKAYRCSYVARQVAVKKYYGLWVTSAERDAMVRVLSACPSAQLPAGGNVPLAQEPASAPVQTTTAPPPPPPPAPVQTTQAPPAPPPAPPGAQAFANCTELRTQYPHGVGRPGAVDHTSGTPVTTFYVSQALYDANSGSDADGDGIACEKR
jgi:hypothetical protein